MLVLKENRISFIQAAIVLVIILAEIFLFRKVLMNAYPERVDGTDVHGRDAADCDEGG